MINFCEHRIVTFSLKFVFRGHCAILKSYNQWGGRCFSVGGASFVSGGSAPMCARVLMAEVFKKFNRMPPQASPNYGKPQCISQRGKSSLSSVVSWDHLDDVQIFWALMRQPEYVVSSSFFFFFFSVFCKFEIKRLKSSSQQELDTFGYINTIPEVQNNDNCILCYARFEA